MKTGSYFKKEKKFFESQKEDIKNILGKFEWIKKVYTDYNDYYPQIYIEGNYDDGYFKGTEVENELKKYYISKNKAFHFRINPAEFITPSSEKFYEAQSSKVHDQSSKTTEEQDLKAFNGTTNHKEIILYDQSNKNIILKNNKEKSLLILDRLAANDDFTILKQSLEKYIDFSIKEGKFHYTALYAAVFNRHLEAVQLLTQYKANTTLADAYGKTPLDISTEDVTYNPTSEKVLDINSNLTSSLFRQSQEAAFKAIYNGNTELAKKVINNNPEVIFWRNEQGYNAFLWAALYNKVELLAYLILEYGERIIGSKDNFNRNALDIAAYSSSLNSFKFLLDVYGWSKGEVENAYNIATDCKNDCKDSKKYILRERAGIYEEIEKIAKHKLDTYIPKKSILPILNCALPISQALRNAQFFCLPEETVVNILTFVPGAEVIHRNTIGNLLNKLVSDHIVSIENLKEFLSTPTQLKRTEQLIRERKNQQKEEFIHNYIQFY
ncbi:hypothetical protein NF27_EF00020 [Candidatus Jidaibacter acanthamoeba]|uniref:Uncharacterized protein n=1 Tax=Candidatus Jidaibacter acanthamoebae TaxID=86105 RepID=A0A0C1MZ02_9RICK|nr:ankyrin repeat domain-containing protein [Candidatus Jidaibacter acanthamoeba]KIE05201.1 hypothetical protein NF27_EF00020 [Candidatus Jidaibacter acanthamoeba]